MNDHAETRRFRLARMCTLIRTITLLLLALPLMLLVASPVGGRSLAFVALFLVATYAWIWLRFRPSEFVVRAGALEVRWPLKRRMIAVEDISDVRLFDRDQLKSEIGWGVRVGAGGLWGGFGWLWTKRRGIVQMYVSRTSDFVWIECAGKRPWLITPAQPEAFARALSR